MKREIAIAVFVLIVLSALLFLAAPTLFFASNTEDNHIRSNVNFSKQQLKITVLTTQECKAFCNPQNVLFEVKNRIGQIEVLQVDSASLAGKELMRIYAPKVLPMYLINATSLEAHLNSRAVKSFVKKLDANYYVLDVIEAKSGFLTQNTTENNTSVNAIELFTSPYTREAAEFLLENYAVLKNFSTEFKIKYSIATKLSNSKLQSIESASFSFEESKRQACVFKTYPKLAFDFAACRNRFIYSCFNSTALSLDFCSSNWNSCALAYTFNVSEIEKCAESQGESLLLDMRRNAVKLEVKAIPTMVVNNKYILVGQFNSTYIKEELCKLTSLNSNLCK